MRGAMGRGQHEDSVPRPWRIRERGGTVGDTAQNSAALMAVRVTGCRWPGCDAGCQGQRWVLHSWGHREDMGWQRACRSLAREPAQGKELDEIGKGQAAPVDGEHINLSTAAGELIRLQNTVIKGQPGSSANAGPWLRPGGQSEEWVMGRPTGEWRRGEEGQARCPE